VAVADVDFVLGEGGGVAGLRKNDATYALIPVFLISIGISNPDLVAVVEIVEGAERAKEMALRRGHIFVDEVDGRVGG
jgi:hypothetical protein